MLKDVRHPTRDMTAKMQRKMAIKELIRWDERDLDDLLQYQMGQRVRDEQGISRQVVGELMTESFVPQVVKNILGSGTGAGLTDGSPLIRQDLEPILYALFVRAFPAFERVRKGPSNGLVHAFNQMSQPDPNYSSSSNTISTAITEIGTVSYTASTYVRKTANITVFGLGRGVSFKEMAAVAQGGAPYDPTKTELANGMVKLAADVQQMIMRGNGTNAGGTDQNEGGAYSNNPLYFDGWRGQIGGYGSFAGNGAVQVDIASLNILESIQNAAAQAANNGGMPTAVFLSMNAKQALDTEMQNMRHYTDPANMIEIIPGVRCNKVAWANGELVIIPVPGVTIGSYNRTSDGALVEDIYVIDESVNYLRWLYSEGFTVLEIPAGFDNTLSQKFIIFGMYGLELAAPLFCAKARRLAA